MRLLFVNHLHPNTGLIGAVRLQRFAEELSKREHRVLLLCACHQGALDTPETFALRIAQHNWAQPLVLAVRDASSAHRRVGTLATGGRTLRRVSTAAGLLIHGGPFWQWQHAARAFQKPIRERFAPELTYATFGNLDALAIARNYAHYARIPWVMDIKDPASQFIPAPLARWLMPRYRDAAAVTLNSDFQRGHNPGWVDERSTVIYSGAEASNHATGPHFNNAAALVGSVYDDGALAILLRGFAFWRRLRGGDATLHYFGTDGARVADVATRGDATSGLTINDQIPRDELLQRCARFAALLYCAHPQHTFHHKLLELGALGRPLVTSLSEGPEARMLCDQFGIRLASVTSDTEAALALQAAADIPTSSMTTLRHEMAWPSVTARLETVFADALSTTNKRLTHE